MPDIIINDIAPRIQYTAVANQTVFIVPFVFFANTDLLVYQYAAGTTSNDSTQLLTYITNYTVSGALAQNGGTITLNIGATVGDIITLVRDMPESRLNNYLDGGQFLATDVNTDFDRTVLMNQTNYMYTRKLSPHYNSGAIVNTNSSITSSSVDLALPILPPLCSWRKNATNNGIEAFTLIPNGNGVILPTPVNSIARFADTLGTIKASSPLIDDNGNISVVNSIGPWTPAPNLIINGDFQVWQRGAGGVATFSFNNTTQYTADRWQAKSSDAGTTIIVSQQAESPTGYFSAQVQRIAASAGGGQIFFATSLPISCCVGAAGQKLAITFKAKVGANFSSNVGNLTVNIYTGTGNADRSNLSSTFVGSTLVSSTNFIPNANLQTFTVVTNPIGAAVTQLYLEFTYVPTGVAGANDWFRVTDVGLQIQPQASNFQRKSFYDTLMQCYPFYQKSFNYAIKPANAVGIHSGEYTFIANDVDGNAITSNMIFYPIKINPNFAFATTLYNPVNNNGQIRNFTRANDFAATNTQNNAQYGFNAIGTASAGTAIGDVLGIHYTMDADLT